jgi:putative iron-regulated protein
MSKIILFFVPLIISGFLISGCSKKENPVIPNTYDFESILKDYTNNVVIATYLDLKNKTAALQIACDTLNNNPTQNNLNAACEAWKTARQPWESSEGFLFGPVSYLGKDPSMDTWPLDEGQLNSVIQSNFELTPDFVRNGLGESLRGYHALEYLLFENGQPRDVSTLDERRREYLFSVSVVLAEDAEAVYDAWISGFGDEFKNAGNPGSRYSTQTQAVFDIIDAMSDIADEVGNGKISTPFSTGNAMEVESQFSWNSLIDFTNNIKSIRNAYLGEYSNGTSGSGLDDFIKSKNEELNTKVLNEIDATINAINAIPSPFRNNLNASVQIQAAINACNILFATLHNDVRATVTN